ncbi:MAG: polyamine aminopropyltransferase [Gammaproteobacteria bacterium]|nr:polyamine aminopropyltransferase [Gammaproteobacteria bacterium]
MREFRETLYPHWGQFFSIDEVLFEHKTEHQYLVIFKNAEYGRVMALDGIIQTTERDEFIYHEMLAHVPILAHGHARRVLIVGGGDGGMLREVLRHKSVEHVTQVEIDKQVIEMCKHYLPNHSQGAFDDARANIVIDDGVEYVNNSDDTFDVVISDSTDPIGPGEALYTSRFYSGCKRCLREGGVLVTQNGCTFGQLDEVTTTAKRLQSLFADYTFYSAAIPTYIGGIMAFAWATNDSSLRKTSIEVLRKRYAKSGITTRYYTPGVHQAAFALPQYVIEAIE